MKDLTKRIQEAVGVKADGVWGPKTAAAVWEFIQTAVSPAPSVMEEIMVTPVKEIEEGLSANPVQETDTPSTAEHTYAKITQDVQRKCIETVNVFETGKKEGDYGNVSIYKDGGGGAYKQITYGASQTTQDGNLDKLLYAYVAATDNQYTSIIRKYLPTKYNRELTFNNEFITALKEAGKNDPIMRAVQDQFFEETYFLPAYRFFETNGFTLPLSMLVIYDSYIHSGSVLIFLRKRFAAKIPGNGGEEKTWIKEYVRVRRDWLANHSNKILRNTVYRMDTMQACIKADNWNLEKPYSAHGVTIS